MKNIFLLLFFLVSYQANGSCDLEFDIKGDNTLYNYENVGDFIKQKVRPSLKDISNNSERFILEIKSKCEQETTKAEFGIQANNYYLKTINDVPLCVEDKDSKCTRGQYNFVDYKGGANITINKDDLVSDTITLSKIKNEQDLKNAFSSEYERDKIHNAVRRFAFLIAESARFDYVLDDIECAVANNQPIKFMDYWVLLHNWSSISTRVQACNASLKNENTINSVGSLFAPVTREMVDFFNKNIAENPPEIAEQSGDGKYKSIPIRSKVCETSGERDKSVGQVSP